MSPVRGNLKEVQSKSWYQRTETVYKAYQVGNVAIDTEAQKPDVPLGGKCCGINGKNMCLTWEVSFLRGKENSAAAIVLFEVR